MHQCALCNPKYGTRKFSFIANIDFKFVTIYFSSLNDRKDALKK